MILREHNSLTLRDWRDLNGCDPSIDYVLEHLDHRGVALLKGVISLE